MDIDQINYDALPGYMQGGMRRWIEKGIAPGGFLCAVLKNDLRSACEEADDTNVNLLPFYVKWLYNNAPSGCWGSEKKFCNWMGLTRVPATEPLQNPQISV